MSFSHDFRQQKGESKEQYLKRLEKLKILSELQRYQFYCKTPNCDGQPHPLTGDPHPHRHARSPQQYPSDKRITAWIMGRGTGKTRSASEAVKQRITRYKNHRVAVIAPTFGAARDVCIEGLDSGLLAVLDPKTREGSRWNRSTGELFLPNGSLVRIFGADKATDAEALRGYQTHTLWFDELATIRHAKSAWDMAILGNRLKYPSPKIFVTTTPKPNPMVKSLYDRPDVEIIRGTTFDNAANLSPEALALYKELYGGTRLGRQELYGELLEDVPGALWSSSLIDQHRHDEYPELRRVVVAIDPAGSHNKSSDETGIVVCGLAQDGEIYVLADLSGTYTPQQWAHRAINAFTDYQADRIVAETNFGGDLVESNLRSVDPSIPFKKLTASRGKVQRAEPVFSLYEQGRVHHVGLFPELEQQMTSWVPGASSNSPDRMDALVWAITELGLNRKRRPPQITHFSVV